MSEAAIPMPSFKVLAAALRETTERLARELVHPTHAVPDWSETEWAIARSAAAMQGIITLLANNLRWSGPPSWQTFLAEQREQSVLRHARIGALIERIDAAMRERSIGCIALKGAALRSLDLYRAGERPMGDVDLLASVRELPSIAAAMADIGYVEAYTTERHVIYDPRDKGTVQSLGEHVDNPLRIEVHPAITEPLPVSNVDITRRLWRGRVPPGLNSYPDLASLLLHLLLHAAGNMRGHALRQIQLHDIAVLARVLRDDDWRALLEQQRESETLWWAFPPLALTARYYPGHIPHETLRAARAVCPRVLRLAVERESLTSVSWSNLRIHAFPGITWSRTPLEALRFVRSRVLPSRRSLAEVALYRRAQPQFDRVPWYGLAHRRRIARWLFSQPPRAQTMVSVQAAFESAGIGATKADA